MANKTLAEVLDEIVIYGGEEGEDEWTLKEIEDQASWDIRTVITNHLKTLKRDIPKKLVFGDTKPVQDAMYNEAVSQLITDIEEGKV